jgi:hypothetical protein
MEKMSRVIISILRKATESFMVLNFWCPITLDAATTSTYYSSTGEECMQCVRIYSYCGKAPTTHNKSGSYDCDLRVLDAL